MLRSRHPPHNGPSQCVYVETTRETLACNMDPCEVPGNRSGIDCEFDSWSTWSECSEACGQGKKERTRTILGEARGDGLACAGAIFEVIGCLGDEASDCGPVDCVWGDWDIWGACSASCGNGLQYRTRSVARSPSRGGRLCDPVSKTEVASCATEKCVQCVDGEWSPWSSWSECSMTCDHGVRSRQRMVAKEPNHCGQAPLGKTIEVQVCTAVAEDGAGAALGYSSGFKRPGMVQCVPDRDCVFSAWGTWSDCLPDCFGVRERNREIEVYSQGKGLPCADRVGEVEPCNPGIGEPVPATCQHIPTPRPCELSLWTVWTPCTVTCGGGQSSRERNIISWPDHNGEACAAHLFETKACNTERCAPKHCPDCSWGPWSEWSHCTRCGGQRERKRSIAQMPNYCGKRCDTRSALETSNCSSSCSHGQYCTWASWTAFSDCPDPADGCGPHTKRRHRYLHYVDKPNTEGYIFEGSGKLQCSGIESEVESCPFRSCIPPCTKQECIFGDWSDWGQAGCDGLCERERVVQRNGECGARPCEGALSETKRCEATCSKPVDCKLGVWSSWTGCHADNDQTYRDREIERPTDHGGKTCTGSLKETLPCSSGAEPMRPCTLTEWSPWSPCHKKCGSSWQVRNRFIHAPASGGGKPCENSLQEIRTCNLGPCLFSAVHNCKLAPWDDWSACRPDGQKARKRAIEHYAKFGGEACYGHVEELYPCDKEDCKLSQWTLWHGCTATCGGGQEQRHRQVDRPSRHGGLACPASVSLKEIRSCGQAPCSWKDCTVEQWSSWAACSTTCGDGQQARTRAVNQTRRMDGSGCWFPMVETRRCPAQSTCPVTDCVWGSWTEWSMCSLTCGGGQQLRKRNIKAYPQPGGLSCDEAPMEEVRPCNFNSCNAGGCVDGEWGSWSSWGHCSASCQGGVSWRWRNISQEANNCGKRAAGPDRQYQSCNTDVTCHDADCEFGEWEDWSGCTAPCNGIKRRSRYIQVFGYGAGAHCNGPLKETAPCHPSEGEPLPKSCKFGVNQDCKFSEWVEGPCSATCGGGHVQRTRHIEAEAIGYGKRCRGSLMDHKPCSTEACADSMPLCHWGDWSMWGACDKCGGERKRNRQLQQVPTNGQACDPGASEEVERCPRTCDDSAAGLLCTWNPWEAWSSCSATCGSGRRQRRRGLVLKAGGSLPDAIMLAERQKQLRQWELQTQSLEQKRFQDLIVAALLGGCAVAAALATILLRTSSSSSSCWRSHADDLHVSTHGRDDQMNLLPALDISD